MKTRIILCFSLLCLCFVGFSISASAVDTGKVCNGGVYLNSALTSPQNYIEDPNGDRTYITVDSVDWSSAPEIIKRIVYTPIPDYSSSSVQLDTSPSPFVLVRQSDLDEFMIFAGYNIGVGCRAQNTGTESNPVFTWDGLGFTKYWENSVLYRVSYVDGVWGELQTMSFDSHTSGNYTHYYCSMYGSSGLNNHLDWYFYGTNLFRYKNIDSLTYPLYTSNRYLVIYSSDYGALTKLFLAEATPHYFCSLFTPMTAEQQAQQTQKGILGKIQELINKVGQWFTNLGNTILNGIKSLFVPSDGFFDDVREDFDEFFQEHFGILYQSTDIIKNLLTEIKNFNPDETSYLLTFPPIYGSFKGPDGEIVNQTIYEGRTFLLNEIIEIAPFDSLYNSYKVMVTALCWLFLILLAHRKLKEFLRG